MGVLPPGKAFCLTRQHKEGVIRAEARRDHEIIPSDLLSNKGHCVPPVLPVLSPATPAWWQHPFQKLIQPWEDDRRKQNPHLHSCGWLCLCKVHVPHFDQLRLFAPSGVCKAIQQSVGILSNSPVTLSFTIWTQQMDLELCDTCTGAHCGPWTF